MADKAPEASGSGKPRTRQRIYKPPPSLDVPDIEANASERKRVLNVLAQRRYRERKRQQRRMQEGGESKGSEEDSERHESETSEAAAAELMLDDEIIEIGQSASASASESATLVGTSSLSGLDLNLTSWDPLNDATLSSLLPDSGALPEFLTGESSGEESLLFDGGGGGLAEMFPLGFGSGSPSSFENMSNSSSDAGFPDSYLLPVHELTLFRAIIRIAERIGCRGQIWKIDAVSPFNQGAATPVDQLPANWQPTSSQVLVPHHPLLDFLPWPGVRDRAIGIFSLPDAMRPPNATGPLAMVNFAYDFEDNSEGVRIYGDDLYNPSSWEVGQVFFERWWFLFDRDVIENSNRWRRLRGAPPLVVKGPQ
ncbi:hypothetical protein PT974_00677 [Cladobotryum mycophilum]|uniref:BZIP domain-containing protein n=1 Tax=Cladobotryum mycophilum TaxID=491253 RepID=A0ABR0T2T5_9HYPO